MHTTARSDPFAPIKATIWLYFWLIILEGALRKWVFPQWSDMIFIIRDPVVLMTYVLAARAGVFPRNFAMLAIALMAILSLAFAALNDTPSVVILFGLRTNYLHLPLVFVMAQVMDRNDVIRYGRWFLITSLPICALMMLQFDSSRDAWINVGAGGRVGGQILGAMEKIRPPGPFSFVSGPVLFFSLVAAFAGYGWAQPNRYSRILLVAATVATIIVVPVSISRALLIGILTVVAFAMVIALYDLRRLPRFLGPMMAVAGFVAFATDSIYVRAFLTRWNDALGSGISESIVGRALGDYTQPFSIAEQVPLFGHGIGLGTVAGARLTTGKLGFLLGESELTRIVMELGPVLGFAFIAWRAWLTLTLISRSWRMVLAKSDVLPWMLTGACFLNVFGGQWGPATQLGFAVFGAGLTLAAMNEPPGDPAVMEDANETEQVDESEPR